MSSLTATDGLAELRRRRDRDRARRDDRAFCRMRSLAGLDALLRAAERACRLRCILRRIHVEERIDRLGRPVGQRDAVTRGPYLDLAQVLDGDARGADPRAARPATARPPDGASRRNARRRAACPRRCAPRAAARRDRAAGTGNRPARSRSIRCRARSPPPNRARRGCRRAARQNPARCRRRPAIRMRRSAPDRRWH